MRIPYLAALLSLLALGLFLSSARAEDKKKEEDKAKDLIVGKWELKKDKDTVLMEFTKDGKLTVKMKMGDDEIKMDGKYEFTDADHVKVELTAGDKKHTEKLKVKVTKDELTTTDEKDKSDTFKRVK